MDVTHKTNPIPLNYQRKINSLSDNKKYIPKDLKKVAASMEGQFAKFMLDQMNKTIHHSDNNTATNIYRDLLTTERSKLLAENKGGMGLQDMILDQIYPKKFRNKLNYQAYQKQMQHRAQLAQKIRNQRADVDQIRIHEEIAPAKETSNE